MIRLLIVDEHPIVRSGLRGNFSNLEDIVVAGEASNGEEAVKLAGQLAADVVLMDLRMPILDGVQATAQLRVTLPSARVIILTTFDSEMTCFRQLKQGRLATC
ncbi:response regulator [Bowdeniella massiliensis]|uniref:response regulator n=1 Tax=Bowdeniella massiliensis TaxID=2932264 RepID=UPI0020278AFF|nr:response regulator transcription factor [Bowdeniella massiliensis]